MTIIPFFLLLIQMLCQPMGLSPGGAGVDYRNYQSPVRNGLAGPQSPANAVCDMMETFVGVPMHLDAAALRAHEHERGDAGGAITTFFQYLLERKGLLRLDSTMTPENERAYTHYHCPAGSVLSLPDASKVKSPGKIVSLLNEGIKGIVVTYAYCPKEWREGKEVIKLRKKTHRPKGQHTVLIVGYQDSTFLFKNSWGTDWGESGYGRMSFSYHESHAREGLVAYLAEAVEPQTDVACPMRLKLQPEMLEGKPQIQVSMVAAGLGRPKEFETLAYTLTTTDGVSVTKAVLLLETARSNGYPCLLPLPERGSKFHLTITARRKGDLTSQTSVHHADLGWKLAELPLEN